MTTSIKSFKPIVLSFTKTILYSTVNPLLMFYFTKFDVYIWFQYKHSDDIYDLFVPVLASKMDIAPISKRSFGAQR